MESSSERLARITQLITQAVSASDKIEGLGARLAVAIYDAAAAGELDEVELRTYATGTSKKQANEIVTSLCSKLSPKYDDAVAAASEKELPREQREHARRQMKAIKQMVSRSVLIAAWMMDKEVNSVTVKGSDLSLSSDDADLDGRHTVRGAESSARKHFGRTSNGAGASTKVEADTSGLTLLTAATWLADQIRGTDADDYSANTRKQLIDLLTCLGYTFAADGEEIDGAKVVELARVSARG